MKSSMNFKVSVLMIFLGLTLSRSSKTMLEGQKTEEERAEEATVDRGLVHDDGIFLVVAAVAKNSDDGILTGGELTELEVLHRTSSSERFLRIVQDVRHRVPMDQQISEVDA